MSTLEKRNIIRKCVPLKRAVSYDYHDPTCVANRNLRVSVGQMTTTSLRMKQNHRLYYIHLAKTKNGIHTIICKQTEHLAKNIHHPTGLLNAGKEGGRLSHKILLTHTTQHVKDFLKKWVRVEVGGMRLTWIFHPKFNDNQITCTPCSHKY